MDFYITIKNGQEQQQRTTKAFKGLKDGTYNIKIESARKRSVNQNRYFHGVIVPLVYQGLRDMGYDEVKTKEDAKLVIKSIFLKSRITNAYSDETIEVTRDTHSLTKEEMNVLIEDVIKWAAQYLSISIAYPNEQTTLNI